MIVYAENPKESKIKLLDLLNNYIKVSVYKGNIQMSVAFLYATNEQWILKFKNMHTIYKSSKK